MTDTPPPSPRQRRQALHWWLAQDAADFDGAAQRRLQAWLRADPRHAAAFEQQRVLWHRVDAAGPAVLAALPGILEPSPMARAVPRRQRWQRRLLAAAAVLALAVGLGPGLLLELRSDLQTGPLPRTAQLPDGSTVVMDADTALAVDFVPGRRQVRVLQGRAWFDVVHQPEAFVVTAGHAEVEDIGTAFSVEMAGTTVHTAVSSGVVEVRAAGAAQRLHAGQTLALSAEGVPMGAPEALAVEAIAPWRRGELILDAVPAAEAVAAVARYHGAPVWVAGRAPSRTPVSAIVQIGQPEQAIAAIAEQGGLQLQRLPGGALLLW